MCQFEGGSADGTEVTGDRGIHTHSRTLMQLPLYWLSQLQTVECDTFRREGSVVSWARNIKKKYRQKMWIEDFKRMSLKEKEIVLIEF